MNGNFYFDMQNLNIQCNFLFDKNIEYWGNVDSMFNSYLRAAVTNGGGFNGKIVFPDCVVNYSSTFQYCNNLNSPFTLPNTADYCGYILFGANKFNKPVNFGANVNSLDRAFLNCSSFNSPVNIANGNIVIDAELAFAYCSKFNAPINFGNRIGWCYSMFRNCSKFNQPVIMNYSGVNANRLYSINCELMFENCTSFSSSVRLSGLSTNKQIILNSMFRECVEFNSPVYLSFTTTNYIAAGYIFNNCRKLNSSVTLNLHATRGISLVRAFANCVSFNRPVSIPDGTDSCSYMFHRCSVFNQPVTMPDTVKYCVNMFYGCSAFNSPVHISNSAVDCNGILSGASNFNQDLYIPDSVQNIKNFHWVCECTLFPGYNYANVGKGYTHTISVPITPYTNIRDTNGVNHNVPFPDWVLGFAAGGSYGSCLGAKVVFRDIGVTATIVEYSRNSSPNTRYFNWDIYLPYLNLE